MTRLPGSGGSYIRDDAGKLAPAEQPPKPQPSEKPAPKKAGLKES